MSLFNESIAFLIGFDEFKILSDRLANDLNMFFFDRIVKRI